MQLAQSHKEILQHLFDMVLTGRLTYHDIPEDFVWLVGSLGTFQVKPSEVAPEPIPQPAPAPVSVPAPEPVSTPTPVAKAKAPLDPSQNGRGPDRFHRTYRQRLGTDNASLFQAERDTGIPYTTLKGRVQCYPHESIEEVLAHYRAKFGKELKRA